MRALYFDCFSGASGDMIVGALLDLGVSLEDLKHELEKLRLDGYSVGLRKVERSHISVTKFDVNVAGQPEAHGHPHSHDHHHEHEGHSHSHDHHAHDHSNDHSHDHDHHHHEHRSLSTIERMINDAALPLRVKERATRIFRRLGEAEATIHNIPIEDVHFHEVGAVDSIVDIVGSCIGFELLGIDQFFCSALNVGYGMVKCAHGLMPVPAPATARLLEGAPVYSRDGVEGEMVTPTGAAIISTLCESYGAIPAMNIVRTGFGAGTRDLHTQPNLLRLVLGDTKEANHGHHKNAHGDVAVIETNIDDMNPQVYGYLMDKLLAAGALDLYYIPVQMKKNRPGILLSVVCAPDLVDNLSDLIFNETTTIGLRYYMAGRKVLAREIVEVTTEFGPVRLKVARMDGKIVNYSAEYDDCRAAAERNAVPLREVQLAAQLAFEHEWETRKQ